jgi:hypothetical protein
VLGSDSAPETPAHTSRVERLRPFVVRHWLFLALFAAGVAFRVVTQVAYRPALLYIDSYRYLENLSLQPAKSEAIGYSAVLRFLLWVFGNFASIAAVQHLIGLGMAVAIYALLLRWGARPWLAALGAAPILLSAYQLQIEQNLLSETWFEALILTGVCLLMWNRRPGLVAIAVAGVSLGLAVTIRIVGAPLIAPAALYALWVAGKGWRRVIGAGLLVAAFAAPLVAYASYSQAKVHRFQLTTSDAGLLAGRAQTIVDCKHLDLPADERQLCPTEPLGHRKGVDYYAHDHSSEQKHLQIPKGSTGDKIRRDFARRVFLHQPLDFTHAVLRDFVKTFAWSPTTGHNDVPVYRWQFQRSFPVFPGSPTPSSTIAHYGGGGPHVVPALATFLRRYQLSVGYLPGPVLAALLIVALLAACGVGRARGSGLRAASLFPAATALVLMLVSDVFEFSWRYQLPPAMVLAPIGGVLGLTAVFGLVERGRHDPTSTRPAPDEPGDDATASAQLDEAPTR